MLDLLERGRDLYRLFQQPASPEELNDAFCCALANAVSAEEIALFELEPKSQFLVCRASPGIDPKELARKTYALGDGLCGAAALTGEITSEHWLDPNPRKEPRGIIRFATPILQRGESVSVIEILKHQKNLQPDESDVFLIQTFGMLRALHVISAEATEALASGNGPDAAASPRNGGSPE